VALRAGIDALALPIAQDLLAIEHVPVLYVACGGWR